MYIYIYIPFFLCVWTVSICLPVTWQTDLRTCVLVTPAFILLTCCEQHQPLGENPVAELCPVLLMPFRFVHVVVTGRVPVGAWWHLRWLPSLHSTFPVCNLQVQSTEATALLLLRWVHAVYSWVLTLPLMQFCAWGGHGSGESGSGDGCSGASICIFVAQLPVP